MVAQRVTANSRNRRPTTSPMNSSGISTAISDTVSERMVKPICSAPLSAACKRFLALLDVARDVLDHHDRVVHHEAGGDGERHQRQVVEAVAEHVHDAEGADQGQRHRHAGDDGGGERAQEEEDHHHHERDGEQQLELHVVHRGADGGGAVGEHRDVDGRRQRGAELRQQRRHLVDHADDVRPRLALDVDDHRRRLVHPRRLLHVLGANRSRRRRRKAPPGRRSCRRRSAACTDRSTGAGRWRRWCRTGGRRRSSPWPG